MIRNILTFMCVTMLQAQIGEYVLVASSFTSPNFSTNEGWTVTNGQDTVTTCGTYRLFGGAGKFHQTTIQKTFSGVPAHYSLKITFKFLRIDSWDDERFTVMVDNQKVFSELYHIDSGPNLCGIGRFSDTKHDIEIVLNSHFVSTISIKMYDSLDQDDETWGIGNLKIWAKLCPDYCNSCSEYLFS